MAINIYLDEIFLICFFYNYMISEISVIYIIGKKHNYCKVLLLTLFNTMQYCFLLIIFPKQMIFNILFRNIFLLGSVIINAIFICKWDTGKICVKKVLKTSVVIFIVSMVTGGITNYFYHNTYIGIWVKDNTVVLIIGVITFIISRILIHRIKSDLRKSNNKCSVKMIFQDKEVCIKALLDTGNNLREPISGRPVSVVEKKAILPFLDKSVEKIYVIPFSSVGVNNSVMYGFEIDELWIIKEDKSFIEYKALIGIYKGEISSDYEMILNNEYIV